MTVILTLGNREQFIQISDRRLTSNGLLCDDESNKAGILHCANGRFAFGFTGLGRAGLFETQKLILSTLDECGPPDYAAHSILERLKLKATEVFHSSVDLRKVSRTDKRLSIMFSGYLYHCDPPLAVYAIITNFQDFKNNINSSHAWDEFQCTYWKEKRPYHEETSLIQIVGFVPSTANNDFDKLRALLMGLKPAEAIRGKALEVVHALADSSGSGGTIGKQLSSIILYRDIAATPITHYHTGKVSGRYYMPDLVVSKNDVERCCYSSITMGSAVAEGTYPLVVPKVGRNAPCPCHSGKKYKWCHGK